MAGNYLLLFFINIDYSLFSAGTQCCRTMQVFGGSWGSTLALAYSQEHPDKVMFLFF
jgi:pimeloyl-ACP methyl ester carboxylesterase